MIELLLPNELQLQLPIVAPVRCSTCGDLPGVAVPIELPNGQASFRLDPCPDCDPDHEDDPR